MATELMTWVSKSKRWQKWYKGKNYSRSCKQLQCESTKAGSRKAANDWWVSKQREIDELLNARNHPEHVVAHYQEALENHRIYAKWHRQYGNIQLACKAEAVMEWLQECLDGYDPSFPLTKWQYDPAYEEKLDQDQYWVWRERTLMILREEGKDGTPVGNTIRAHVDQYLELRASKIESGQTKLGTYQTFMHRLNVFRNWVAPDKPIEDITEDLWEEYYLFLSKKVKEGEYTKSTWSSLLGVAREFIRSRWEKKLIDLPRNLKTKLLSVSVPIQKVVIFEDEEIAIRYAPANERMKLSILLALNCGFYQVDIGSLLQQEVDWNAGRIIRKRTKTRDVSEKTPIVNYKLWDETFRLLKKYRSDDPNYVLLGQKGMPLWREYQNKKGEYQKSDAIKNAYGRLQRKLPKKSTKKPFKTFRKTAASKLYEHGEYGKYVDYFLGEAPPTIALQHYVKPSIKQFDIALKWLGDQFVDLLR